MTPEHNRREKLGSPTDIMTSLMARIEDGLVAMGQGARNERTWGHCDLVTDIASYCVEHDSGQRGYNASSSIFHITDLHLAAANLDPKSWDTDIAKHVFRHGINVVVIQREAFLVDLSFAQFIGDNGYIEEAPGKGPGIRYEDSLLAQALVQYGFVPLNAETLQEYLRITTRDSVAAYTREALPSLFDKLTPIPLEIFPHDWITPRFGLPEE